MTWRLLPAIWESDLLPLDKLVLLCLAKYSDASGRSSKPAQATISRLTGIGARRVRTALATLKQRGLIVAEGKGRKGTISYAITLPLANKSDSTRAAHVGTSASLGRHQESYNPIDNQLTNPSERKGEYFDSDLPGTLPGTSNVGAGDSPGRFFGQWETVHERSVRLNRERMKRE